MSQHIRRHTKDEIYKKTLNAALKLDFKHGHLRWTITDLSKSSGTSRSLIYYYFGKSKSEILAQAVKLIGSELAGFTPEKLRLWSEGKIAEALLSSRLLLDDIPALIPFYYSHRAQPTPLGKLIQKIEKDFHTKITQFFPAEAPQITEAIHGLFLGLSFTPNLSENAVRNGVTLVLSGLKHSTR